MLHSGEDTFRSELAYTSLVKRSGKNWGLPIDKILTQRYVAARGIKIRELLQSNICEMEMKLKNILDH
jgi:hypothetical protein